MKYLSVCSGIEAATVAWHPLGWEPVGFSEIEPFPSAVLAHHYPHVPNFGDMTKFQEWPLDAGAIDLLVGGTPCQSFSVAGLRQGLKDPRGNLMLTYLAIAARLRPRWVVWENVPGVLSSNGGRDFGSFLGGLAELGYGISYRVLDAQWCRTHGHPRAVPQRRRRVFVVGCLGDATAAAKVLFERESVQRHSAKSGAAREEIASDVEGRVGAGCWWDVAETLIATDYKGPGHNRDHNFISQPFDHAIPLDLRNSQRDTQATTITMVNMQGSKSNACVATDGTSFTLNAMHGHDVHAVAHAFYSTGGSHGLNQQPEVCPPIKVGSSLGIPSPPAVVQCVAPTVACINMGGDKGGASTQTTGVSYTLSTNEPHAVAFPINTMTLGGRPDKANDRKMTMGVGADGDQQFTLQAAHSHAVAQAMTVRRLTPRECERLQGFPDDYTLIPWRKKAAGDCPDGPRYKALGNSMAVNCMAWIGERIAAVEAGEDK